MPQTLFLDEEGNPVAAPALASSADQSAIAGRIAGMTQTPSRVVAPNADTEALRSFTERAYSQLPMGQAEQAVEAAMRFQGMRGYQRDLQAGTSADQAMAKWAPMMMPNVRQQNLAGAAALIRATKPAPQYTIQKDPTTGVVFAGSPTGRPYFAPASAVPEAGPSEITTQELWPGSGIYATRMPGSKRYQIIDRNRNASVNPAQAASLLAKLPEIDAMRRVKPGEKGSLTSELGPELETIIRGGVGKPKVTAPVAPPSAPTAAPTTKTATSKREVIRRTKEGRRAVFDADTKAFLRYADAQ